MLYYATASEIEKLDQLAVKYGLEIRQMMELAGWYILAVFDELKIPKYAKVIVVCGKGNKAGDGLSAARHLINHGWKVEVVLLTKQLSSNAKHHLKLIEEMKASILLFSRNKKKVEKVLKKADIIIDALIGYRLKGAPRGACGEIIKMINNVNKKVIAYDIPTGIDVTTGECFDPGIIAEATLTLGLPKKAFQLKKTLKHSGQIFLADIGIPAFIYDQLAIGSRPDFEASNRSLIKLS